jgi:hypothetical protein
MLVNNDEAKNTYVTTISIPQTIVAINFYVGDAVRNIYYDNSMDNWFIVDIQRPLLNNLTTFWVNNVGVSTSGQTTTHTSTRTPNSISYYKVVTLKTPTTAKSFFASENESVTSVDLYQFYNFTQFTTILIQQQHHIIVNNTHQKIESESLINV